MRILHLSVLVAAVVPSLLFACSSSDDQSAPSSSLDAATDAPETSFPDDAANPDTAVDAADGDAAASDAATDATSGDPLPPVDGTLEAKIAGSLPTTAATGVVTLVGGSAQWRPAPFGGGRLAVTLVEGAPNARTFELTIQDDDGALDAEESFTALATSGPPPLSGARVETYGASTAWQTNGDGTVKVKAFSTTSVTLELGHVGQFVQPPGSNDTFVLDGTVTVALADLPATTGGTTTLTVSHPQNEPGGDALNLSTATDIVGSTTLGEEDFPYVGKRRAIRVAEGNPPSGRRVLVSFPSGHLPHQGASIPLTTFERITIALVDGTTFQGNADEKIWEADQGSVLVQSRTATSIVLAVQGARMQSESPKAKGFFTLDGTITVALP